MSSAGRGVSADRPVGVRALLVALGLALLTGCGGGATSTPASSSAPAGTTTRTATAAAAPPAAAAHPAPRKRTAAPIGPPFTVAERVITFVDQSRLVEIPGVGHRPRELVTLVRYPAHAARRFPLVVFGHGYAVTPDPYAPLLRAWARAGYVVAAPLFPLENANAPGGPNEADLVNQPADMSFVITRMLTTFADLVDPHRIAVTGQSDGGETALAVAYDRHFIDRRVGAAVILSGAVIPGVGGFDFPAPSPPLLATQGTADTINPPSLTHAFFDIAPAPKYLLTLFGAPHLGPYTDQQPQLGVVARVSIAFLNRYLKGARGGTDPISAAGDVSAISAVQADP